MNNSVFISYRRSVSSFMARAVFQDLRANGIDAFMDVENIDSGQFDTVILNQIAARPYFLLILTPGTLNNCANSGDWLLREIEHAMKLKRMIIPLVTPNFSFDDATQFLQDPLASELSRFNAVNMPHDYFEAAMEKLRTRFLKPVDLSVTPTPKADKAAVQQKVAQAADELAITKQQLSAQDYFERAQKRPENDWDGQIADYTESLRLDPQFANAYYNRGLAWYNKGDLNRAIADYDKALHLSPQYADAYNNRGAAHKAKGDLDAAMADYTKSIELRNPLLYLPFNNRGVAHKAKGDLDAAIADYNEALRLNPQYADAYYNRGVARTDKGDLDAAIADYNEALRLNPQDVDTYYNRALAYQSKKDKTNALNDFQQVLRIKPKYRFAKDVREQIAALSKRK